MSDDIVLSILRCVECNKPFDKPSTLKRHGYYCRSRRAVPSAKSRSCISCARGKARCDNKIPGCSRCMTKAIQCQYPASAPRNTGSRIHQRENESIRLRKTVPSLVADSHSAENSQEEHSDGDIILDGAPVTSEPVFADIGGGYLDWDDPNIDFTGFLNPQPMGGTVQYPSSGRSSPVHHRMPPTHQTLHFSQAIFSPYISIPKQPTTTFRSLIRRPKVSTGAQRTANLILHTLKSYPLMMLRHNSLPPFIHRRLISSDANNDRMEPLANCICLVHMISGGLQGSRKLFWKNVEMECERMCQENLKLNKWELLAGMQALSIYILIRLDEGETEQNNLDSLLLATVTILSKRFAHTDTTNDTQQALFNAGLKTEWENWLFKESSRRLCVVYQVVNKLVYFEPATLCDLHNDLILAPLPAKKQLWEADDEFMWKMEMEREPWARTDFGLSASGELVKLDDGQQYCGDAVLPYDVPGAPLRTTANWEEWCSGMDGLGGLVMLTASLVV
ncbi:hypothetical protein V495_01883 [Pseudogymnoascus sp. VKM F-4514 (FW-929)]|nr:hypothetical protein V495_01883 [Pseudogymnoascus sp. VKM F-4514 (FW-929)]KFY68025.1 hypothetical protein V497_00063 [Pseudogymnoascus sp. VKM F-4516 (FW-969)]